MTNAEAKEWIVKLISTMKEETSGMWADPQYKDEVYEALDTAIKALSEPTIPLSVIEKIHDAIDNADCDACLEDENGSYTEEVFTREHVHEIIDKAVKE